MSLSLIAIIKAIIFPPTFNFIFIALGLITKRKKVLSQLLLYFGLLLLLLCCLPVFSKALLKSLEKYPALIPPVSVNKEQAIVVLSGGSYPQAKEYGKSIDGHLTLQRNNYAAFLHKQTQLPVLVTGGKVNLDIGSEAAVMADTLNDSFNVEVKWEEAQSLNTAENAIYSAAILKENGIDSIFLVTHAWHMPRSVMLFEQQGLNVTPAPTIFVSSKDEFALIDYLPSAGALYKTRVALHEYLGLIWYKLRY
jgi:uncharacterized SAM-binding protein YcdF (DUF218 family)